MPHSSSLSRLLLQRPSGAIGTPRLLGVLCALVCAGLCVPALSAQDSASSFSNDKFRQLEELLPTPNVYRAASGAPGHDYWQQVADYDVEVEIDDEKRHLRGSESITYRNHSPDTLRYLWVQLDQNLFNPSALGRRAEPAGLFERGGDDRRNDGDAMRASFSGVRRNLYLDNFEGGNRIEAVKDADGAPLEHTIVETMMRIDLPQPLEPGSEVIFSIDWWYPINDAVAVRTRSGYECFEAEGEDGNCIYEMAQWFPRMAAYTDVNGWQHKQFLGRGEFTLEFGDYRVAITVPDDHVVTATGVLQNPDEVLTATQRERLEQAESADAPVFVVTPDEAKANESSKPSGKKTWIFEAENVRDFAFASSRKFIWDAWGVYSGDPEGGGRQVMSMSFYPNEAEPLWSTYSTHSIVHTLETYSRYSFEYPYPVAISVNGPVGGMEYPMICFNGPRTEEDGTYWGPRPRSGGGRNSKFGLISVIIHEVGHNYFPMIVNSDERQWTWMDEGLNTFLQSLAEMEWEEGYPSRRGEPKDIVEFMTSENQVPIMTNSESLLQFGSNAYAKPATALNVLRETVLGRELFDFAFREFARRWQFKRPQPSDFFRSMEDASGVDLDWFWRGWFYTTDHVDIAVRDVHHFTLDARDPDVEKPKRKSERDAEPETRRQEGAKALPKRLDRYASLKDFYNTYDPLDATPQDREEYGKYLEQLEPWEKEMLGETAHFYVLDFENVGGLVMPILLRLTYDDGSVEDLVLPAEIWRYSPEAVSKLLVRDQPLRSLEVDPHLETADANVENNYWPSRPIESRFQLFKQEKRDNPMQEAKKGSEKGGAKD